jgi:hypothetical protein
MTKKYVKDSLRARGMSAKRSEAPKVPKITQTSPPEQREGHEKYSLPASAAIKSSW